MSSPFSKNFLGKNPIGKTLSASQEKNLNEGLKKAIEAAPEDTGSTPLQNAYEGGADRMVYASERDIFQNFFNTITDATNKAVEARKSPEAVSERLEKRVKKRERRGVRKKEGTITDGVYTAKDSDSNFNTKTERIRKRASEASKKAREAMEQRIKDAERLRGTLTPEERAQRSIDETKELDKKIRELDPTLIKRYYPSIYKEMFPEEEESKNKN